MKQLLLIIALLVSTVGLPQAIYAQLVDTDLQVRYYVDEAISGTGPAAVLDGSGVGSDFDLTIDYDGTMSYTEVGGNSGLESTSTTGDHRAEGSINNTSDKLRDNILGAQKVTMELVVRIDDITSDGGRVFVINESTSNPTIGFAGTSSTDLSFYWGAVKVRSWDPGTVRTVWHAVVDTTQGTANDRVLIYKDGLATI